MTRLSVVLCSPKSCLPACLLRWSTRHWRRRKFPSWSTPVSVSAVCVTPWSWLISWCIPVSPMRHARVFRSVSTICWCRL